MNGYIDHFTFVGKVVDLSSNQACLIKHEGGEKGEDPAEGGT